MEIIDQVSARYIQHYGSDKIVVDSARVSYGAGSQDVLNQSDIKLITYLAANKHYSPFEHLGLTVKIECPLFIRSQIMRHRTFSYNEISRRYTSKNMAFYMPTQFFTQAEKNKQCSGNIMDAQKYEQLGGVYLQALQSIEGIYNGFLQAGMSREQARAILPQCTMTEFYMSGNLRNWAQFIELRNSPHAQKENNMLCEQIISIIEDLFPYSSEALLSKLIKVQ